MNRYRLYWRYGETEIISGENISDAFRRAGIGGGALAALDHWEVVS